MENPLSVEVLKKEQEKIIQDIYALAQSNGLSNDNIEPIADGVNDIEAYLDSHPRVMWVLKEPYDDFTKENSPWGGGWNICDVFNEDYAWKNYLVGRYGLDKR